MKLTRQQRDKLWGEEGPYSQVQQIIESRILDDHVSRQFVIVSVNINPLTFEMVKEHRDQFLDDKEILGILDFAHYQGQADGYVVYTYNDEYRGAEQLSIAKHRTEVARDAVIKMHQFVMNTLGVSSQAVSERPRASQLNLHGIFSEYLIEQQKRLSPKTFQMYEGAVGLFEACCDGYGYNYLDEGSKESFERIEDTGVEFCDFFGSDILSESLFGEFLGYFLPRKVASGNDTLKKNAQAIIHLYGWCCEKGYIQDDDARETIKAFREEFREVMKEQAEDESKFL
ncbi:hypothetical protein HY627_02045 [Candidatus Uhrbacteria bacterium]|nr:hypothetical protein [Candidatus Uhrbacteria bacterium]